ncbi:MAG TPA: hypothetical protein VNH84_10355, partial [Candidatus Saccharimonadales bacterium]|nr:hypothetical protein [Candidatus Saccharimonadales bacterium]
SSGFAPLRVLEPVAARGDGQPIPRVDGHDGRVVVIGREALLEANRGATGGVWVTLYGRPGSSYQVVREGALTRPAGWGPLTTIGLETLWESFPLTDLSRPAQFLSAYELAGDPPLLEVDASGELVLFGLRGATYRVEKTTDLTGASGWSTVTTVTLTDSFRLLEGIGPTDGTLLFRAIRQ